MDFLNSILSNGMVQALIQKALRHAASIAAGALTTWLLAHHATPDNAETIAGYAGGLILAVGAYGLSWYDAKRVGQKNVMTASAAFDAGVKVDGDASDPELVAKDKLRAIGTAIKKANETAPKDAVAELERIKAGTV